MPDCVVLSILTDDEQAIYLRCQSFGGSIRVYDLPEEDSYKSFESIHKLIGILTSRSSDLRIDTSATKCIPLKR